MLAIRDALQQREEVHGRHRFDQTDVKATIIDGRVRRDQAASTHQLRVANRKRVKVDCGRQQ
jgi:hypothetical protein